MWWTPTAPHHGLPVESDDPKPTRARDGEFERVGHPGAARLGQGPLRPPRHGTARARRCGAAPRPTCSDKPIYLKKQSELTPEEKAAETEVTRQRGGGAATPSTCRSGDTLAHLRRTGQLKHTVVVFTSDNGYYLGEHRKRSGKINLHEPSLRVPLLIAGPGVPHGRRYDPVTTVDLAPTFAAYAGTTMSGADGTSILPLIRARRRRAGGARSSPRG